MSRRSQKQDGYDFVQQTERQEVRQVRRREVFGIDLQHADEICREAAAAGIPIPPYFLDLMMQAVQRGRFEAWATVNIYPDGSERIVNAEE